MPWHASVLGHLPHNKDQIRLRLADAKCLEWYERSPRQNSSSPSINPATAGILIFYIPLYHKFDLISFGVLPLRRIRHCYDIRFSDPNPEFESVYRSVLGVASCVREELGG